jgi:hypothetical protein
MKQCTPSVLKSLDVSRCTSIGHETNELCMWNAVNISIIISHPPPPSPRRPYLSEILFMKDTAYYSLGHVRTADHFFPYVRYSFEKDIYCQFACW